MLEHNGHQGSKGVDISYSPPPLLPPALQLTSWQPWGLWLVMAYCLDPINAWPPLCPRCTLINKSNLVSGRVFYCGELAPHMGRLTTGWLHTRPVQSRCKYLWGDRETQEHPDMSPHLICLYIQFQKVAGSHQKPVKTANGSFPLPNWNWQPSLKTTWLVLSKLRTSDPQE